MNLVGNYSSGEEESDDEVFVDKKRKEAENKEEETKESISKKLKKDDIGVIDASLTLPSDFDSTEDDVLIPPQVKYVLHNFNYTLWIYLFKIKES